jgi:hypothetical protein
MDCTELKNDLRAGSCETCFQNETTLPGPITTPLGGGACLLNTGGQASCSAIPSVTLHFRWCPCETVS